MKDKYLQYDSVKLAEEEEFISWVRSGDQDEEWQKYLEENPLEAEKVAEAKTLVEALTFQPLTMDPKVKADLWKKIDEATPVNKEAKTRRLMMYTTIASAAAVLLLIAVFLAGNMGGKLEISTDAGSQELVQLPDQSLIKLNAVSTVSYNEKKFNEERKLKLEGEAFFDVEEGSKFAVELDNGIVEVLGTSFNIYSRNDSVAVQCYTGRVRVSAESGGETILLPGEIVTFGPASSIQGKASFEIPGEEPRWTSGYFAFDGQPLAVVIAELERQFNVNVMMDDPQYGQMIYNGFFENESLEKALQEVFYPMSLQYTVNGNKITISQ